MDTQQSFFARALEAMQQVPTFPAVPDVRLRPLQAKKSTAASIPVPATASSPATATKPPAAAAPPAPGAAADGGSSATSPVVRLSLLAAAFNVIHLVGNGAV